MRKKSSIHLGWHRKFWSLHLLFNESYDSTRWTFHYEVWSIQIMMIKLTNKIMFQFVISIYYIQQPGISTHTGTHKYLSSMWKIYCLLNFVLRKSHKLHIFTCCDDEWIIYSSNEWGTQISDSSRVFSRYAYNSIKRNNVIVHCRYKYACI